MRIANYARRIAGHLRPGKRIFLSYRRADTQDIAEQLYELLSQHFGATNVFLDRADIEHGERWFDEIERQVDKADVVVALIGSRWLELLDAHLGSEDVLRFELARALQRGKQVVPVLVGSTPMPDLMLLPDLRALSQVQALTLAPNHPDRAVRELLGRLKPGLGLAVAWSAANVLSWLAVVFLGFMLVLAGSALGMAADVSSGSMASVAAFAAFGALLGLCIGLPQWMILRAWFDVRFLVPAYVALCATAFGFAASSLWSESLRGGAAAFVMLFFIPLALSLILWWLVRRQLVHAGWWSATNALAPFATLMVTGTQLAASQSQQVTNATSQASLVGLSSLPLTFAPSLVCGLLLVWLMRRSQVARR